MTQKFRLLASAAILCGALIAAPSGLASAEKAHAVSAADQATANPHWTYEGEDGPDAWGKLHGLDGAAYPVCATGDAQSPIDLYATNATGSIAIETDYKTGPLVLPANGHTFLVKAPVDSSITIAVSGITCCRFTSTRRPSM